jgi:transcriptional regulator
MYIPENFNITEQDEIFSFIESNGFGQLTSQVNGRLFSTHVPFLVNRDRTKLIAHVAKQNPQHTEIEGQEVLITLQGPHDYISPSWYGSAGVPTWNYQAVHVYGQCVVFTDVEKLNALVAALTEKYESTYDNPWQPNFNAAMLTAIVGIEVSINEIQCKYKLSQNRSSDVDVVTQELKKSGSAQLAGEMLRIKHQVII